MYIIIGVIGLAWYVLWLYVINGNYSFRSLSRDFILFGGSDNSRYSLRTSGVSLTRTIVSEIPWKSICTSKPVLAIALMFICDTRLSETDGSEFYGNVSGFFFFNSTTKHLYFLFNKSIVYNVWTNCWLNSMRFLNGLWDN